MLLLKINALKFTAHPLQQLNHSNTTMGWAVGKEFLVGGVYLGEIGHTGSYRECK